MLTYIKFIVFMKLVTNKKMNLAGTLRTMDRGDILEVSSAGYAEAYVRSVASAVGREKDGRYVVNAIYDENKIKITRVQ